MQNGPVFGKGQKGPKFSPAKDSLQCVAMAATLDVQPNDEMFFEYRKYLADGEPHKHRHSMIAVKHFDTNYKCDLSRHISIYEHAHLLMLKVDLHPENKEIELHWLDERDLPEMHLTQYGANQPTEIKSRWKLASAKPLAISSQESPDNPELKEYTLVLVHGGFEPTYDHLQAPTP